MFLVLTCLGFHGCEEDGPTVSGTVDVTTAPRWGMGLLTSQLVWVDKVGLWSRAVDAQVAPELLYGWAQASLEGATPQGPAILPWRPGAPEIIVALNHTTDGDACRVLGLARDGALVWQADVGSRCLPPAGEGRLVTIAHGSLLTLLNAADGQTLAQHDLGVAATTPAARVVDGVEWGATGGSHWTVGAGGDVVIVHYDGTITTEAARLEVGATVTSVFAPAAGRLGASVSTSPPESTKDLGSRIVRLQVSGTPGAVTLSTSGDPILTSSPMTAFPVANDALVATGGSHWTEAWDWTTGQSLGALGQSDIPEVVTAVALGASASGDWVYTGGSHWLVGGSDGWRLRRWQPGGEAPELLAEGADATVAALGSPLVRCDGSVLALGAGAAATSQLLSVAAVPGGVRGHAAGWPRSSGSERVSGTALRVPSCAPSEPRRVATGPNHSCAVFDGEVACWGANDQGQLGVGAATPSVAEPALVDGVTGTATGVATGLAFSCAVTDAGNVFCWGANLSGQLGQPAVDVLPSAVQVDGIDDAVAVTAGIDHACALLADGVVACWGNGGGFGATGLFEQPQPVLAGAVDLATAAGRVCGIGQAGAIACAGSTPSWSDETVRRLGLNSVGGACLVGPAGVSCFGPLGPSSLENAAPGARDAAMSDAAMCLVDTVGDVQCAEVVVGTEKGEVTWGPLEPVVGTEGANASQVARANAHGCAATADGYVCWGERGPGLLGDGARALTLSPGLVPGVDAITVGLGATFGCAHALGDSVACWGDNSVEQLGTPDAGPAPVTVVDVTTQGPMDVGGVHWCAVPVGSANALYCRGDNSALQLGSADPAARVNTVDLGQPISQVAAGAASTCVVLGDEVRCWGQIQAKDSTAAPVVVPAPTPVDDLAALKSQVCVQSGDTVSCGPYEGPLEVRAFSNGVASIGVGSSRICALLLDGGLECLVGGAEPPIAYVVPPPSTSVAVGLAHLCVVTNTGEVQCLGDNRQGQLGVADIVESDLTWLPVPSTAGTVQLDSRDRTTCATGGDSSVVCWGNNRDGQTGQAGFENSDAAVPVSTP